MNKELKCNECGNKIFYVRDVKMHKGLYCYECGLFKKWTTKSEIYFLISKNKIDGGDDYK